MKKLNTILILSLLVMIFNSCDERKLTKTNTQPSFNLSEDSDSGEVIDTYYLEEEKHFDGEDLWTAAKRKGYLSSTL
jgi:hypothetical protein